MCPGRRNRARATPFAALHGRLQAQRASERGILKERDIIRWIRERLPKPPRKGLEIGDDASVFRTSPKTYLILTTDQMIEDVHFRRDWGGLDSVGWRIVARNVSDIRAMGGIATQFYLTIALGPAFTESDLNSLFRGLVRACRFFNVLLCGGDTSESPAPVCLSGTCVGETRSPVFRATSHPGDSLWVSAGLGRSYAGWRCLTDHRPDFPDLVRFHLYPRFHPPLGYLLSSFVSSMVDISDGLSSDVTRLHEESGNGFLIEGWRVRIPLRVRKLAREYNENPLDWAIRSGEEYELLFTIPGKNLQKFTHFLRKRRLRRVHCIGRVLGKGEGVYLQKTAKDQPAPLTETGWEHHIGVS